jgi:hypothetical protein
MEGAFRPDLPARTLSELYVMLLEGVAAARRRGRPGAEEASAALSAMCPYGWIKAGQDPACSGSCPTEFR